MEKEFVIVGAGIAGLYTAYKILQNKTNSIVILEKEDRVGGRLMQDTLLNVNVPLGGGIIRYPKDKHLIRLIESLGLKLKVMPWKQVPNPSFMKELKYFKELKDFDETLLRMKSDTILSKDVPFFEFVNEWFKNDQEIVREFYDLWGYTDMLYTPAHHVLDHYGIEDVMFTNSKSFALIEDGHWDALINKLVSVLVENDVEIRLKEPVTRIERNHESGGFVETLGSKRYRFNKQVYETIDFNNSRKYSTPWPFMRIYLQSKTNLFENIKASYVTNTNLQRVIGFTPQVVMASYCDGVNALYWREMTDKKKQEMFSILLGGNDSVVKDVFIRKKFWQVGIHYFDREQLKSVHAIPKNCVGEWVSETNQGWVEGAIESVDSKLEFF